MTPRELPVDLTIRFDQFPATVKGAFVLRGADGNPHAAELATCSVQRIPQGPAKPIPVGDVHVNVAPGRDLFVPFEVGVADLDPGWYLIRSALRVDAGRTWTFGSRGFVMPWPREAVRRGVVRAGRTVRVGGLDVLLESVDMRPDCAVVTLGRPDPSGSADMPPMIVSLTAGEATLDAVPAEARPFGPRPEPPGRWRFAFYPVPRGADRLTVLIRSGDAARTVELSLT